MTLIFIAGGARSGKSRKGEELAKSLAGSAKPIFIATAEAFDDAITIHTLDNGRPVIVANKGASIL